MILKQLVILFFLSTSLNLVAHESVYINDINAAQQAHASAKDYHAWIESKHSPKNIFANYAAQDLSLESIAQLCTAFKESSIQKLLLFSDEIYDGFSGLHCQQNLIARIEKFWLEKRTRLSIEQLKRRTQHKEIFKQDARFGPSREIFVSSEGGPRWVTGDVEDKEILITFDDGPHRRLTPRLIEILQSYDLQVNFFWVGNMMVNSPEIVLNAKDLGHSLGTHSWSHEYFRRITPQEAIEEVFIGFFALDEILRHKSQPFFRYPYGAGIDETKLYLKENNISEFFWNIDTRDWEYTGRPEELLEYALAQVDDAGRGIALFHDIQSQTIEMMPRFLDELIIRGYKPVVFREMEDLNR